jgi:hypothetical protein
VRQAVAGVREGLLQLESGTAALRVIMPITGNRCAITMRAPNAVRPTVLSDQFKSFASSSKDARFTSIGMVIEALCGSIRQSLFSIQHQLASGSYKSAEEGTVASSVLEHR